MLRYSLAALALKTFSLNETSRKMYRGLGNTYGARRRIAVEDFDSRVKRGDLLVELLRKYDVLEDGNRLLEIGTGWMHWFSLYAGLYFDLRLVGFDVWDNRQFSALQAGARKLRPVLEARSESPRVLARLDSILAAKDMDELYRHMRFEYCIEPEGSLAAFDDSSFDSVISFHVLEHVPRDNVETLLLHMHRVLKPGATIIHQIGIDDHLAHYDKKASKKQYLKYSDRTWKALFENRVQYFNRVQASEWERMFADAGFTLVERIAETADVRNLQVHPRFQHLPEQDYGCTILTLVHRKQGH